MCGADVDSSAKLAHAWAPVLVRDCSVPKSMNEDTWHYNSCTVKQCVVCVVCGVCAWCVWCVLCCLCVTQLGTRKTPRVKVKNVSVCRFKTSPCVPEKNARMCHITVQASCHME